MIQNEIDLSGLLPITREGAIKLVSVTDTFSSRIVFKSHNTIINGKSMLGLMALRDLHNAPTMLECDGTDEEEAAKAVLELLNSYKKVDKL